MNNNAFWVYSPTLRLGGKWKLNETITANNVLIRVPEKVRVFSAYRRKSNEKLNVQLNSALGK